MARFAEIRPLRHIPPTGQHDTNMLTLAAVMTAVAAVLIASVASVFIYSNGSSLTQTAQAPLPPPAVYERAPPETTGAAAH